jgi:hypothetical protein
MTHISTTIEGGVADGFESMLMVKISRIARWRRAELELL